MDPITEIEVAHAFDLGLLNSSADIVFRVYQTTFRVHQTTLVPKRSSIVFGRSHRNRRFTVISVVSVLCFSGVRWSMSRRRAARWR